MYLTSYNDYVIRYDVIILLRVYVYNLQVAMEEVEQKYLLLNHEKKKINPLMNTSELLSLVNRWTL